MDLPDNVCEPCQYRQMYTPANIYCNTCRESYCKLCADVHRASKIGRSHFLVDIQDETVKGTTLGKDLENTQSCKTHSNKSMEFYCSDHATFICSMCLLTTKKHKMCKRVIEISSAGKELIKNKFTVKIHQHLQEIVDQAKHRNETAMNSSVKSKEEFDSLNSKLAGFVDQIDALVTSLKHQAASIKHNMTVKFDKQQMDFESSQQEIMTLVTTIESCQSLFDTVLKTGSPADIFRCAVSMVRQYNELKAEAQEMKTAVPVVKVAAETDEVLHKLEDVAHMPEFKLDIINEDTSAFSFTTDLSSEFQRSLSLSVLKNRNTSVDVQQLGTVNEYVDGKRSDESRTDVEDKNSKESDKSDNGGITCVSTNIQTVQQQSQADMTIQKSITSLQQCKNDGDKYKINVEFDRIINIEKTDSEFSGIVSLPDGRMILSDSKKSRLLIQSSSGKLLFEIPLAYVPEYMTTIDGKYLLVCVRNTKLLLVMEIDNKKIKTKLITQFHPKCVQAIDSTRMLVSMKDAQNHWYLHVMPIDGSGTKRIIMDGFYDGYSVAVQHISDNSYIIICCECNNTIRRFDITGKMLHTETFTDLSSVVTDQQGFVYAVKQNGNVVVYSPNFESSKKFTSPLRGRSYATFNAAFDKIYVLEYKTKMIVVMNVSRTNIL